MTAISTSSYWLIRARTRWTTRTRVMTMVIASITILIWLVSLSRNLFDPLGFDQALYQYITQRVLAGDRMYADLYDQNAPGIIAIHWLATHLVGSSPMSFRLFDATWQSVTLAALIALGVRGFRDWRIGWAAAGLYALAYYGLGYIHTGQREGFAVLPLLLAVHALIPASQAQTVRLKSLARPGIAGVMAFTAFCLKPPLGLCYAVLWLVTFRECWRRRREGISAFLGLFGITMGFIIAAAGGVALLVRLQWWSAFWPILTRRDVPAYVLGPQMIRQLAPYGVAGIGILALTLASLRHHHRGIRSTPLAKQSNEWARMLLIGTVIFGLLLTIQRWPAWQQTFLRLGGLMIPAAGAMLLCTWQDRSRPWRIVAMLTIVSWAGIVWQGHYALYQYPPLLAFAACLAAQEIVQGYDRFSQTTRSSRIWTIACVACIGHLAVSLWGWTMTFYCDSPYVLANTSLTRHYTRVTRHKARFPTYETTAETSRRVQALTGPSDPIACLIDEPRIYCMSNRPAAHPLLRTQECYAPLFADFLNTIARTRPKVLLARIPEALRPSNDMPAIEAGLKADLLAYFGPSAEIIHQNYRITEIINHDVCILQPRRTLP